MRTIGVGVIGMGWMGEAHARAWNAVGDRFFDAGVRPRLVACADSVAERAEAAGERFGFAEATTDWRAVVAHPGVEIVDVTAPNGLHVEINLAVAAAGKHLACEIMALSRANEWNGPESVGHGVFCELGTGCVDFPGMLGALDDIGYVGWVVVEQDILPGIGTPLESARHNRAYLRAIGA